jgi:isopentenyl-diphosphate delta-isomerase
LVANEVVEVVDESDRAVGVATVADCLKRGLLHRAVAVIVVRTDGEIILQERSKNDRWHPGRWTLSCTGHVKARETYRHAAERELGEELGLSSPLRRICKILMPRMRSRGLTEWEHVVLFSTRTDQEPVPDPVELEGVHILPQAGVERLMSGRKLTPDAKRLLARYFNSVGSNPRS